MNEYVSCLSIDNDIFALIEELADRELKEISCLGYAKEGNNGSYYCDDTPVRNSSHWCVSFSILYRLTGNRRYRDAVVTLAQYISNEIKRNPNGTVKCMNGVKFDSINGLIGQAWAIEGLVEAARALDDDEFYRNAKRIFNSQIFNKQIGYWERIDIESNNLGIDRVFNHQLWFAAAGALICALQEDDNIHDEINQFMENCAYHFKIRKSGLIRHYGEIRNWNIKKIVKDSLGTVAPSCIKKRWPDKLNPYAYEASYHLFNLYGFALIQHNIPGYGFFGNQEFKKALRYGLDIDRLNRTLNVNSKGYPFAKFSYGYNSPAFEYGFVEKVFERRLSEEIIKDLWNIQVSYFYSDKDKMFSKNNDDPRTLTARIYEFLRVL